ncbi:hypothetical protein [Petrachloros mirabilis]
MSEVIRLYRLCLCLFMGILVLVLFPVPLGAARGGGKTEVMPVQTTAPAAVVIETTGAEVELRKQLRSKNGVVELTVPKTPFSQAQTGSFGFIAPSMLGMALVTQSPDLLLDRVAPTPNAYEIHKLADGSGMVVGFIPKELIPLVTPVDRPKGVRVNLYSSPSEKALYIAAVPLVKLMVDRMPVKLEPKKVDGPVMLDMDLQGSANRKSVPGSQ